MLMLFDVVFIAVIIRSPYVGFCIRRRIFIWRNILKVNKEYYKEEFVE